MKVNNISLMLKFKNFGQRTFRSLHTRYNELQKEKECQEINNILSKSQTPSYYDSQEIFEYLQTTYSQFNFDYKYDYFSTWSRGTNRALQLIQIGDLYEPSFRVLEAGCGDGMTGYTLSCYGHDVTLIDLEDWRDNRAKNVSFISCDLCSTLPLESNSFDLIYSYNTFEHLTDPSVTFAELVRVSKPGGFIHLYFDPLYASPWGLHAYRTIHMPYSQFLFSPNFIYEKLQELSIYDLGKKRDVLQPLNQWRLQQFQNLWQADNCEIICINFIKIFEYLNIIKKYPNAFCGLGLTFEDITTKGVVVTLKKR